MVGTPEATRARFARVVAAAARAESASAGAEGGARDDGADGGAPGRAAVADGDARRGVDGDVVEDVPDDSDDDLPLMVDGAAPRKNLTAPLVQALALELRSRRADVESEVVTEEEITRLLPDTMAFVSSTAVWSAHAHLLRPDKLDAVRHRVRGYFGLKGKGKGAGQATEASRARKEKKELRALNKRLTDEAKEAEAARVAVCEELLRNLIAGHDYILGVSTRDTLDLKFNKEARCRGRQLRRFLDPKDDACPTFPDEHELAFQYYEYVVVSRRRIQNEIAEDIAKDLKGLRDFSALLAKNERAIAAAAGCTQQWAKIAIERLSAPDPDAAAEGAFGDGIQFGLGSSEGEGEGAKGGKGRVQNLQRGRSAGGFSKGRDPSDPTGKKSLPVGALSQTPDALRKRLKRADARLQATQATQALLQQQWAITDEAERVKVTAKAAAASEENPPPPPASKPTAAPPTSAPRRVAGSASTLRNAAPFKPHDINGANLPFRNPIRR